MSKTKALKNNRKLSENFAILIKNSIDTNGIDNVESKINLLCFNLDDARLKDSIDFNSYNDLISSKLKIKDLDTYDRDFVHQYLNYKITGTGIESLLYSTSSILDYIESSKFNLDMFDYFDVHDKLKEKSKNYNKTNLYVVSKGQYLDYISIKKTGEELLLIGKLITGNTYFTPFKNNNGSFCVLKEIKDNDSGKYSSCYDCILVFECDKDPSGFVEMPFSQKNFN